MESVLPRRGVTRAIAVSVLLALCLAATAWGQGQQVSGTVTSATSGEKLWGVTVRVKGTSTQTVTDRDGRYALVAPPDAVLTFALIGYLRAERPVGGQATLDVALQAAPTVLQEVVVTGYTTQRRGDITGAVSSVDLAATTRQSSTSVLQRLDGQVAGVTVNNSGSPGSRSTVRIRGVSSFHNNEPLYIVDGTPLPEGESYLNFLDPNDIGQMQVLKDASAASIYGSRASNGVVIIETKKGQPGGRSARLDVRTGVASPTRGYDDFLMTDALQYYEVIKRAYHNAGQTTPPEVQALYGPDTAGAIPTIPRYTYIAPGVTIYTLDQYGRPDSINTLAYSYPSTLIMPASAGTDWWKAVFSPAQYTDAHLSLSGGGPDNVYNVAFGYLRQNGTAAYNQVQRGSLRINTAFNASSKLTIGENLSLSREQRYGGLDDDQLGEDGIVGKNILMQPIVPIYDISGVNFASGKATGLGNNTNPLKYAWARRLDRNTTDRALGNAFAEFALAQGLSARTRFSVDLRENLTTSFNPTTFENSEANATNSISQNDFRQTSWTVTNTLTYARTLQQHTLNVLLGQEAISNEGRGMSGGISGLLNDALADRYIDDALGVASTKVVSSTGFFDRLLSFFGKVDYNYNERYYASVTLRRDGSSKFAPGERWGTFPAFNVGWRVSREPFFPQGGFFSNAMLRFGWGITGNQQIPGGRIVAKFGGSTGDTFYDISGSQTSIEAGYRQIALGNTSLKWEENKSTNVGVDLEFLQGRGNLTADWYNRITDNLLFDPRQPSTAGAANPAIANVGKMRNRGIDFAISYSGAAGAGRVWSVAFNGSHYSNVILRIDGQLDRFQDPAIGPQITRIGDPTINEVGQPIGAFYGKVANGYYPDSATAAAHRTDSTGTCATAPCQPGAVVGGLRFVDINGDGKIDANDRTIIGSPHPKFTAGLDLGFRTGAWDFSATLYGSFGAKIYDAQKDFYVFRDFSTNVVKDRLSNSFCIAGDEGCTNPGNQNAKYPRLNQNDLGSDDISSFFVESGTYVRLRSLQIGWQVPGNLISWLPSGRIYVQAENLFTLTGYPGLDPSLPARAFTGASGDIRDQFRNVDVGVYPSSRTFTVGITTSF
jgi:TonB-linked SusC/RagA family outer membrane protein